MKTTGDERLSIRGFVVLERVVLLLFYAVPVVAALLSIGPVLFRSYLYTQMLSGSVFP